jgi:hypothetical protein
MNALIYFPLKILILEKNCFNPKQRFKCQRRPLDSFHLKLRPTFLPSLWKVKKEERRRRKKDFFEYLKVRKKVKS